MDHSVRDVTHSVTEEALLRGPDDLLFDFDRGFPATEPCRFSSLVDGLTIATNLPRYDCLGCSKHAWCGGQRNRLRTGTAVHGLTRFARKSEASFHKSTSQRRLEG